MEEKMKRFIVIAFLMAVTGSLMAATASDSTATIDFDFSIPDVSIITVTGGNIDVKMPVPVPGEDFVDVTAYSAYEVYHNSATAKKITAELGSAITDTWTTGVDCLLRTDAPSEGTEVGFVSIADGSEVDIVTALGACSDTDLQLEFRFEVAAGTATGTYTDILTLTLTD